ncbi:hypothetical protein AB0D49_40495 [Streptomyces sp. NPDC048290]|uniref:hypothetical protein n=1 Tax=Streptomyces sp. NPDC048290 TaxID=3155811 RepID=UPI003420ECFD
MQVGKSKRYDRKMSDLGAAQKLVQIIEDGFGVATGDMFKQPGREDGGFGNRSSAVLGSYKLTAKLESVDKYARGRVRYTVQDTITRESGMRSPTGKGYQEGKAFTPLKILFDGLQRRFPNGQRPTQVKVSWTESIAIP